ncbi:MAG: PaaI family thioesterase [Desulfarculus sp.]|nr:MAG: PaaI family thioesterase [Desulfarculus sp.]
MLAKMLRGEAPPPPIAQTLGFVWTVVEPGRAVCEMEAAPRLGNLVGALHGGVLCTLADAAMGAAHAAMLADGESNTTVELKINFLRPVQKGRLRAVATVLKQGRSLAYAECEVQDQDQELVAKVSGTFIVLRGPAPGPDLGADRS